MPLSAICSFCQQGSSLKSKHSTHPEILSPLIQTYFPVKREETGLWHHSVVQDLNLPGWWQSVQAPGCGVSHWFCQAKPPPHKQDFPLGGQTGIAAPAALWSDRPPESPERGLGSDPSAHTRSARTQIHTYSHIHIHAGTSAHTNT